MSNLRERYAAIFRHAPGTERPGDKTPGEIADLILAARDQEIERLQGGIREVLASEQRQYVARLAAEAEVDAYEDLREQLRLANIDNANTAAELAQAEAERDALKAELARIAREIDAEREKVREAEGATARDNHVINGIINGLGIALKIVRGES